LLNTALIALCIAALIFIPIGLAAARDKLYSLPYKWRLAIALVLIIAFAIALNHFVPGFGEILRDTIKAFFRH